MSDKTESNIKEIMLSITDSLEKALYCISCLRGEIETLKDRIAKIEENSSD